MGGESVSTRGVALMVLTLMTAACGPAMVSEPERFRAQAAYERALGLTRQEPARRFLERRLAELRRSPA